MKFHTAIDLFLEQRQSEDDWTDATIYSYRRDLQRFAADIDNRDPAYVSKLDIRRHLMHWSNANTKAYKVSILRSFYDWAVEEGYSKANPARQVKRPKKRKARVYKLRREEALKLMPATRVRRERLVVALPLMAGLRLRELRGLRRRHIQLDRGFIDITPEIGKGRRHRLIPILPELHQVLSPAIKELQPKDYLVPKAYWRNPGVNTKLREYHAHPSSPQSIRRVLETVVKKAGLSDEITPHTLRHAYADFIARSTGDVKIAQVLLGHAELSTTDIYLSEPSPDELAAAVSNLKWGISEHVFQGQPKHPLNPLVPRTGFEPVIPTFRLAMGFSMGVLGLRRPECAF